MPGGPEAAAPSRNPHQRRRRALRTLTTVCAAMAMVTTVGGCGLLGGSSSDSAGGLEKPTIKVGELPIIEATALHVAQQRGYFKQQGLTVDIVDSASGSAAVNSLTKGDLDIAMSSYVPFFAARSKGADLKVVADAYSSRPGVMKLMARPGSGINKPKNVLGEKVAVSGQGTISQLALMSTLKTHGLNYNKVKYVPMPFNEQAAALQRGDVDAAVMTEPFITQASKQNGAISVADMDTGPTADFPLSGWGATGDWARKNPKTMAAFQRAMAHASRDVQNDRSIAENVLPTFAHVDPDTAKLIKLGTFESTLEPSRIQRVPNLMHEFGLLPHDVDVSKLIVPMAQPEDAGE